LGREEENGATKIKIEFSGMKKKGYARVYILPPPPSA
jgi:hypothetical protein